MNKDRILKNISDASFFDKKNPLKNHKHLGIVEDNQDPLRIGRCKIRLPRLHDPAKIDTEDLPWSFPKFPLFFGQSGKAGSMSVPKNGSIVTVELAEGDQYSPEYYHVQELAQDVKDELQKEYGDGVHIIGFDGDEELKMFHTPEKGLTFKLKDSYVNIGKDSAITIEHKETQSTIELRGGTITITSDSQVNTTAGTSIKDTSSEVWMDGKTTKVGHNPQYSAVLGEPLFAVLQGMAAIIDAKLFPTPNVAGSLVQQMKKLTLSNTVKVSK